MSEGKLFSRREIAKRIAESEKITSQVNWKNNDCIPRAVAFTHGYPVDSHSLGLYARATVQQAMDASQTVAERSGENVTIIKFVVENKEETQKQISECLNGSDKSWLFFGNENNSHAVGILKIDDDEFLVANLSQEKPYLRTDSNGITDHLMEYKQYIDLAVIAIGFKKK